MQDPIPGVLSLRGTRSLKYRVDTIGNPVLTVRVFFFPEYSLKQQTEEEHTECTDGVQP